MYKDFLLINIKEGSRKCILDTKFGKLGENLACQYLTTKGYRIIERNFKMRQGEIDIIAIDKEELVFIEVKTRTNYYYGVPIEAVDSKKQKHLLKAVEYYLYKRNLEKEFVRIDVIEIYLYKHKYKINHIKQIIGWVRVPKMPIHIFDENLYQNKNI